MSTDCSRESCQQRRAYQRAWEVYSSTCLGQTWPYTSFSVYRRSQDHGVSAIERQFSYHSLSQNEIALTSCTNLQMSMALEEVRKEQAIEWLRNILHSHLLSKLGRLVLLASFPNSVKMPIHPVSRKWNFFSYLVLAEHVTNNPNKLYLWKTSIICTRKAVFMFPGER